MSRKNCPWWGEGVVLLHSAHVPRAQLQASAIQETNLKIPMAAGDRGHQAKTALEFFRRGREMFGGRERARLESFQGGYLLATLFGRRNVFLGVAAGMISKF